MTMRVLALGDIFGRPGRKLIETKAAYIKREVNADFVIANIENASAGKGVSEANAKDLLKVEAIDMFTSGNHIWDKKDVNNLLQESDRIIRPANYPEPCTGKGYGIYRVGKKRIGVVNLSGNVYMNNLDNPFTVFDRIYQNIQSVCDIIIVDFHAEATSEKIAFGYYVSTRATAVYGTHTHVPTADERILDKHTGFITDIGMCGPLDGVIGVDKNIIIKNFVTQRPVKHEVAEGPVQLNGVVFEFDDETNKCISVERVRKIFE